MNLAQALSFYATLQALVAVSYGGLRAYRALAKRFNVTPRAAWELRLHYNVLGAIALLLLALPYLPSQSVFQPPARFWSARSLKHFSQDYKPSHGYLSLPTPRGPSAISGTHVASAGGLFFLLIFGFGAAFLGRDLRRIFRNQREAHRIRRVGRVRLWVSPRVGVPYAFWFPGQAHVMMPTYLLENRSHYRFALGHELQHHRQRDSQWLYALWFLRGVCILNPFAHRWVTWIQELQEFACDEALVDRRNVEAQAYARCLYQVAQTALGSDRDPVCATGLAFRVGRHLLTRRVEKMLSQTQQYGSKYIVGTAAVILFCALTATATLAKSLVQDRRIQMSQAQEMAQRVGDAFPVVVNESVLRQLNRFLGTPEGREHIRVSLQRMKNYEEMISEQLRRHHMPTELMALPIIESGYQNLAQGSGPNQSAGLWQFIPSTARNFGLRVNFLRDDRLDEALLTDAAMRYLKANHLRFKDWQLSLMAYNMGENAVQKGIDATGSRDAWVLIQNGHEGDRDYLAKMMAAVLILKNPDSAN